MYKIFKHLKHPCIRCLRNHRLICNNKIFFICFFLFIPFATQLFSTPVTSSNLRNQCPLFTELRLLPVTFSKHLFFCIVQGLIQCVDTYITTNMIVNHCKQSIIFVVKNQKPNTDRRLTDFHLPHSKTFWIPIKHRRVQKTNNNMKFRDRYFQAIPADCDYVRTESE